MMVSFTEAITLSIIMKPIPGIILGGAISSLPHRKQAIVEQGTWDGISIKYSIEEG